MEILDEILEDSQNTAPTFHPIHERSNRAWYPGNEAASLLIMIATIWEDIETLAKTRAAMPDDHTRKLLMKYVIMELRSLMEVLDRLIGHVMKAEVSSRDTSPPYRGLTQSEHVSTKRVFKEYSSAKKATETKIIHIRNNIAAHRGNIEWPQVMRFWDAVSIETIEPVLNVVPKLFEHVKELDIYEWNRQPADGVIEILGPRIFPKNKDADA
ncbi:MAG: hypothetical protein ACOY5H_12485 [Pseudomonadota bacterium]